MRMRSIEWLVVSAAGVIFSACSAEVLPSEPSVGVSEQALRGGQDLKFSEFTDPAGTGGAGATETRVLIVRAAQYQRLFGHAAPKEVDFAAGDVVVFYSAGVKRTGGYDAAVVRIQQNPRQLEITTQLSSPGAGCPVTQSLTQPHVLVKFRPDFRIRGVRFLRDDIVRDCTQPGPFCGGIAAIPCPGLGSCVDAPGDGCDPDKGGADCGGVCECNVLALCVPGFVFDSSPDVCDCVPDPSQDPCAAVRCAAGTHCEAADGTAECVPNGPFCGGLLGLPCPGAGSCVDDPSDDCDPDMGGADCGGMCICNVVSRCPPNMIFDPSPKVCSCVPLVNPCATVLCITGTHCEVIAGEPNCIPNDSQACGSNVCAPGQVCCNASCGICTPPGQFCIQIACN